MIYILRGIPGCGKTTYCKNNFPDAIVCSADNFFIKDGVYQFDISKIGEAHKQCFSTYYEVCHRTHNNDVIVDNTNIEAWEISPYIALANLLEKEYIILNFICDQQIAFNRQQHGVPEKNHKRMFERHAKATLPKWNKQDIKI